MNVPCIFLFHAKLFALTQIVPHTAHLPQAPMVSHNQTLALNASGATTGYRRLPSLYHGRAVLWLRNSFFWPDSISKRVRFIVKYLSLLIWFNEWSASPRHAVVKGSVAAESRVAIDNRSLELNSTSQTNGSLAVSHVPKTKLPIRPEPVPRVQCNPEPLEPAQLANYSLTNPFLMNDSIYNTTFSPVRTVMYRYLIPSTHPKEDEPLESNATSETALADSLNADVENGSVAANDTAHEHCVLYFYYHKACPYSAHVAPEINALPRLFPQIFVLAIDTKKYWNHSLKSGLMYVPNLVLIKGKHIIANFEGTMNTDNIVTFVTNHTNLQPRAGEHVLLEEDYRGPIPTEVVETNPLSYLCWFFIAFVFLKYLITNRNRFKPTIDNLVMLLNRNHAHLHAD